MAPRRIRRDNVGRTEPNAGGKEFIKVKTLKIRIASYERMNARTLEITKGEHRPAAGEPTR